MKNILLIGNYSCVNRGDAAILDGLITGIEKYHKSNFNLVLKSVDSLTSQILFDKNLSRDFSEDIERPFIFRLPGIHKFFRHYLFFNILLMSILIKFGVKYIPKLFLKVKKDIDKHDIVIQVGGSYFIDLYSPIKYLNIVIAIILKKKIFLAGHSIGPFKSIKSKILPSLLFPHVEKIFLREGESEKYLNELYFKKPQYEINSDTAFLINNGIKNPVFYNEVNSNKPLIAITVRNLHPFDKRLGVSQEDYENSYVKILNKLINKGYHIISVSMGTGLGNYKFDDRIPAYKIKSKLDNPSEMTVLLHEYNHLELGYILGKCNLLIGTRLHSVILALRNYTPSLAIFYEHKSKGILNKMGLIENSFYINEINSEQFNRRLNYLLEDHSNQKDILIKKIDNERDLLKKMVNEIIN